jgi:hypothetical protein
MREMAKLSTEEIENAISEDQGPEKFLEIKNEWYKAPEDMTNALKSIATKIEGNLNGRRL